MSGCADGSSTIWPKITARAAASGRRAHQRCNVLGCPCRIDFSREQALLMASSGRATSMSFFFTFGRLRSSFSKQPDTRSLLELSTDDGKPFLTKRLECAHEPPVPDAAVVPNRYQMAVHGLLEPGSPSRPVFLKVQARQSPPDLLVVPRHQKANVAQAVVHPGGEMPAQ